MNLFKLLSVFEITLTDQLTDRPVRIEIFQSTQDSKVFRPRVWVKNTYNVYPMTVNTGPNGEDLHHMHSSDDFNNDISLLLADDSTFYTGSHFKDEEKVLEYAIKKVSDYFNGKLK